MTTINCEICSGSFRSKDRKRHERTKKHRSATGVEHLKAAAETERQEQQEQPRMKRSKDKSKMHNMYDEAQKYIKKLPNKNYEYHKISLPFRMCIVGASGSGKSAAALSIIRDFGATFEKIVFCCLNKAEPLYEMLQDKHEEIEFYENEIPDLDTTFHKGQNGLIIFDDLVNVKALETTISNYFKRARKNDCSCMYLSQSYFGIPKFVRLQCNYIIIKKVNSQNDLRLIISDFALGIPLEEMKKYYNFCFKDFTRFFLIDLQTNDDTLKYRCCFEPIKNLIG